MNVIVLTPDRVGSSLLQKFITMVMQGYDYGKPVVNLHELTNGLVKYHNDEYNRDMLTKPFGRGYWGYHQSLKEIVEHLDSTDHYKVSRLAQYHILNRKDLMKDQLSFYQYINDNFYIIGARRENLFEHALSWCIVAFTKKLNCYTHEEKMEAFKSLYDNKITIDLEVFTEYLDKYLDYLKWSSDHFMVNKIFNYEKDVKDLDGFVNKLDIFPGTPDKKWGDIYGMEWNKWNACHYLLSDLTDFSLKLSNQEEFKLLENTSNTEFPTTHMGLNKILSRSSLSLKDQQFLQTNLQPYFSIYGSISKLVYDRKLIHGVPIKLQTLAEKALVVKNFQECIDTYNNWSEKNNLTHRFSVEELGNLALSELSDWYDNVNK